MDKPTEKNKSTKRAKGGAEKERDRKKKRLMDEGKHCKKIDELFLNTNLDTNIKNIKDNNAISTEISTKGPCNQPDQGPQGNKAQDTHTSTENQPSCSSVATLEIPVSCQETDFGYLTGYSSTISKGLDEDKHLSVNLATDSSNEPGHFEQYGIYTDFFNRPSRQELKEFFTYHPQIPTDQCAVDFDIKKVFFRSNHHQTRRLWLSYNTTNKKLYCFVCLAFCGTNETNVFMEGMSDWRHVHQRINEHEHSNMHGRNCQSYFSYSANKTIDKMLFKDMITKHNSEVTRNRQIVDRVINVIKLIGKRGLSFRGASESSYTLDDENLDHGNFLEIIMLIGKYDIILKTHLDKIIEQSKEYKKRGVKQRVGNFLTYLSKTTVNNIIFTIATKIKEIISKEIIQAVMYSVELDTTQDISVTDQCSVVIRYVYQSNINERLLGVIPCHDTSGKGFHTMLKTILEENGLKVENCIADSTDGAANMQGKYNGFSTKMTEENNEHIHIWCHSHILNLVVGDILKSHVKAAGLFTLLNYLAVFFKDSHKRMGIWRDISNDPKKRSLQTISETRWWAKEVALIKVFGNFGDTEASLFIDVLQSLFIISNNPNLNGDARGMAKNLLDGLLKYENILLGQIFLKIFSVTGPLSRYLQTKGLNLLICNSMVKNCIQEIKSIQRDMTEVERATDNFLSWATSEIEKRDLQQIEIEENFPETRHRTKKKFFDEKAVDEQPQTPKDKFRVETYNVLLDVASHSMVSRFAKNGNLCRDFAILDPKCFNELKTNGFPEDAMQFILPKIKKFDEMATLGRFSEELSSFINNWDQYKLSLNELLNTKHQIHSLNDLEEFENHNGEEKNENIACKNMTTYCQNCVICCYIIILKYNMYQEAYPMLALAYQYLLTIPISQVTCERSFSVLKYIKNRLRNRLSDDLLEAFMLMNIEKSVLNQIENDEIIDKIAGSSSLLKQSLIYE